MILFLTIVSHAALVKRFTTRPKTAWLLKLPRPLDASSRVLGQALGFLAFFFLLTLGETLAQHGQSERPRDVATKLPPLTIEVFSDQTQNATAICFDDFGRLYVCEAHRWRHGVEDNLDHPYWIMDDLASSTVEQRSAYYKKWIEKFQDPNHFTRDSDRVLQIIDTDGDGKADVHREFAGGFNADVDGIAIGLLPADDSIFLACIPNIWKLSDRDNDGQAEHRKVLHTGFGVKTSLSGHDLHGLTWGPDGYLYFSIGDRAYHVTTQEGEILKDVNAGAVFRCQPDGSDLQVFFAGLRNPQEIAFNEYGDLFTVDNNSDLGDASRVCYLLEGGTAGWQLGAQALTSYRPYIEDGQMGQNPHWISERMWELRFPKQTAFLLPPIAHLTEGPSGMIFNSGTSLSDRYKNHFLVCDYVGSSFLSKIFSFKVEQQGASYLMSENHLFHRGIANADLELGYDGKIYVADFGGGWKRSDSGSIVTLFDPVGITRPVVLETKKLVAKGFVHRDPLELVRLLSHPDIRIRQRAQFALAKQGQRNETLLSLTSRQGDDLYPRLHAIWALGQLEAGNALLPLLDDKSAELRAQAVRTLGNIGFEPAAGAIRQLILDASPRVRTFAAIAAGKLGDSQAFDNLVALLEQNADHDPFERHAAVFGLSKIARSEQLLQLCIHESTAVRLGALLTFRRLKNAEGVAKFLADEDEFIVIEAVRAINDAQIEGAMPQLAEFAVRNANRFSEEEPSLRENLFRRFLNANLRTGTLDCAANLLAFAHNAELPEDYRCLSLKTLGMFDNPPPIDPTLGIYSPLPARDALRIRAAVETDLSTLFNHSSGKLATACLEVMSHYGIDLEKKALDRFILDQRQPHQARLIALRQLAKRNDPEDRHTLRRLVNDLDPRMRCGAFAAYVEMFPDEALATLLSMLKKTSALDLRTAYRLLAKRADENSTNLLSREFDKLLDRKIFREVRLDLYLAAKENPNPLLQQKVARFEASLPQKGRTIYGLAIQGGDVERGRDIFQNQGTCMKCHVAELGGGDAGPPLTHVSRLRSPEEILQSIVEPNAVIVPGYGAITLMLDTGKAVTGSPLEENDEEITLKTAMGDTVVVSLAQVEDRSELISPMPKHVHNLTLLELRDLMSYLTRPSSSGE